jgi:hypothetical protein
MAVQNIEIEAERAELQAEVLAAELNEQAANKEAEIARAESDALENVRASQKPQESAE